ncbi:hypothetical protein CERSUDRAFT_84466, partial [Gelatoporia subvermispora B]
MVLLFSSPLMDVTPMPALLISVLGCRCAHFRQGRTLEYVHEIQFLVARAELHHQRGGLCVCAADGDRPRGRDASLL